MTPEEIEELFKRTDGVVVVQDAGGDEDDDEPTLTEDETSYRVARLKDVLLEAQSAWDGGSEVLDRIAEKLGDGSRRCEWHGAAFLLAPRLSPCCSTAETKHSCNLLRIVAFANTFIYFQLCGDCQLANQVS